MSVSRRLFLDKWRAVAVSSVTAFSLFSCSAEAALLPSGGFFVAGHGTIEKSAGGLVIRQSSPRAVIDWPEFSIGEGQEVLIDNGNGVTLIRVKGDRPSWLDGSLRSTGEVVLVDPTGIVKGAGGRVLTGGSFVASTRMVWGNSFLNGGTLEFAGTSGGAVVNAGSIASSNGDVVLIGESVTNSGSIRARKGTAGLAAGDDVLLQAGAGNQRIVIASGVGNVTSGGFIEAAEAELKAAGGTTVHGIVRASGGPSVGKGFVETSGHTLSIDQAVVDAGPGGQWLLDPYDLTVDSAAASTINASLAAGTSVSLVTTADGTSGPGNPDPSGHGDIVVKSAIRWSTAARLSLSAYRNIAINNNINVSGSGSLSISAGNGAPGDYSIAANKSVVFTAGPSAGASFSVNGTPYTLLYSMSQVASVNASNAALRGHYALAKSVNASTATDWVPLGTNGAGTVLDSGHGFSGVFAGLGNEISNLQINMPNVSDVGLFGYTSGAVRDLGMVASSISGLNYVGSLAGYSTGTISGSHSIGNLDAVTVTGVHDVGGLVGQSDGTITESNAEVHVQASAGTNVGGLAGKNSGSIVQSWCNCDVENGSGTNVGGLVGRNSGSIIDSYSNGEVRAATQTSTASNIGGIAGNSSGTITNVYTSDFVGGEDAVDIAGVAGYNSGTISNAYWDRDTGSIAGINGTMSGVGPDSRSDGTTALTTTGTSPFQSGSYAGFDFSSTPLWNIVPGRSFPYLQRQFPTGAPQVVSGVGLRAPFLPPTANNGIPQLYGYPVDVVVNGARVGLGYMAGNGFFDILLPPGTIPSTGTGVLLNIVGYPTGETFYDNATGSLSGVELYGHFLTLFTAQSTVTDMAQHLAVTQGALTAEDEFIYTVGSPPDYKLDMIPDPLGLPSGTQFMISDSGPVLNLDQLPTLGSTKDFMLLQMTAEGSTLTQSVPITASRVSLVGEGAMYNLNDPSNTISIIGADVRTLSLANTPDLTIGSANTIRGVTATTLALNVKNKVKQSQPIIATDLLLKGANASFSLTNAANQVRTIAGSAKAINFTDNSDLSIGTVKGVAGLNAPNLTLTINNGHRATQTAGITATSLSLLGVTGDFDFTSGNNIAKLAGVVNTLNLADAESLGVVEIGSTKGLVAAGDVVIGVSGAGNILAANSELSAGHGLTLQSQAKLSIGAGGVVHSETINLTTSANAVESTTGQIECSLINVSAQTGIKLVGSNRIATIGTDITESGPNVINH